MLASLTIIGRLHWIDAKRLRTFILASQDVDLGGIGDRPGNLADPFHTLFGMAGLALLATHLPAEPPTDNDEATAVPLKKVNPVFCLAQEVIDRLGIDAQILPPPPEK